MKTNTTLITCSHQLSLQHEFQSFMEQIWITLVIPAAFRPACEHNLFFHGSTQRTDSFPTPLEKQFLPPQQSNGLLSLNSRWKQHQRTFPLRFTCLPNNTSKYSCCVDLQRHICQWFQKIVPAPLPFQWNAHFLYIRKSFSVLHLVLPAPYGILGVALHTLLCEG